MDLNAERYADPDARRFEADGAYAQVLPGGRTWMLDWAFEPGRDDEAGRVLSAALAEADDGRPVQVWVREPTPAHDAVAAGLGLAPSRDLHQLRVPLPLPEPPPPLDWVPFRPGVDEEAWLVVNNRAFDWHLEQGGWGLDQILEEEAEPWFDPAGFVMHWVDGRLAGFCWTKIHPATGDDPVLGEIYVIGADPDFAGRGLGGALTATGLDWMHRQRGAPVGMLYVDGDNDAAVRLYDRLGFTRHHTDRAYAPAEVDPPD
ncbi:MAG: mycothiol synthase [Acidimicrobiia bacterium]